MCSWSPKLAVGNASRNASRFRVELLPRLPMSLPSFRPFSQLTTLELSAFRLGNLALLPSLVGLVSPLDQPFPSPWDVTRSKPP